MRNLNKDVENPNFYEEKDAAFLWSAEQKLPNVMHVGLHRTGTSFCQKIIFPQLAPHIAYFSKSEVRIRKTMALFSAEKTFQQYTKLLESNIPVLLSQEAYLGGLDKNNFENITMAKKINPSLKVIITVRSQKNIIPSLYHQKLKSSTYSKTINHFTNEIIKTEKLDYHKIFLELKSSFKRDEILFLFSEDIFSKPQDAAKQILIFISGERDIELKDAQRVKNQKPKNGDILAQYFFNRYISRFIKSNLLRKLLRNALSLYSFALLWGMNDMNHIVSLDEKTLKLIDDKFKNSNKKLFRELKKNTLFGY
jgi:hypothetical protein